MNRSQPTNSTIYPHGTFRGLAVVMSIGGIVGGTASAFWLGFLPTLVILLAVAVLWIIGRLVLERLDARITRYVDEVMKLTVLIACAAPFLAMMWSQP